jgi:DNA-binding NtrC family response regulator
MAGIDGLEVLRRLRVHVHAPIVTVLTAHATMANTIEAMRLGAFDHLTKPIARADVARVLQHMLARAASPAPRTSPASENTLIGSSEAMRVVQKTIGLLADSDATVLITGETGTGKELVAHAIHDFGHRKAGPFVAVNCAAIPSELMESELFGHTRGAFTGAVSERSGAFQQASGGTLFLDEIGDMDIATQAKILRALQERVITPIGGRSVSVDVRVIAGFAAAAAVTCAREVLYAVVSGSTICTSKPRGLRSNRSIVPPCPRITERAMARPRPIPWRSTSLASSDR